MLTITDKVGLGMEGFFHQSHKVGIRNNGLGKEGFFHKLHKETVGGATRVIPV